MIEKLKAKLNKPLIVFPAIAFFAVILVLISLFTWKPSLFKGAFGMKTTEKASSSDVASSENKMDIIQNQNDNSEVQSNQSGAEAPKATALITTDSPVGSQTSTTTTDTPVPTNTPATTPEGSWANSHGTFAYADLGKTIPMYLGNDTAFTIGWSTGSCVTGTKFTIPAGTKIYKNYAQVPGYVDTYHTGTYPYPMTKSDYIYDLRGKSICNFDYYEEPLSSSPSSIYYPGTLGIYW